MTPLVSVILSVLRDLTAELTLLLWNEHFTAVVCEVLFAADISAAAVHV